MDTLYPEPCPLLLAPQRVRRLYSGGALLERWLGYADPADSLFPEAWYGAVNASRLSGAASDEGRGIVHLPAGWNLPGEVDGSIRMPDLLAVLPALMLGTSHAIQYGTTTAVLLKVLDSAIRLTLQVHPDQTFAQQVFQSSFGKEEAWVVLETRTINGEAPYVLYGLERAIPPDQLASLVRAGDLATIINAMYRLPVTPGDVIYLPAGTLHAIGPGCMIAEVQEPTDFTISLDTQFAGQPLSDAQRFLGLSLEQALTAVRTTPLDALALARNRRIHGSGRSPQRGAARVTSLTRPIGDVSGDKFWVELAAAGPEDELDHAAYGALALGIVTSGAGQLCGTHGGDSLGVHQGDGFVLPAGLGAWRATSSAGLRLILCGPQPSTAASIARAGRA